MTGLLMLVRDADEPQMETDRRQALNEVLMQTVL